MSWSVRDTVALEERKQPIDPRQRDIGTLTAETLVPFAERPEDVLIFVTGATGAGAHNLCLPSFGNTRAVTIPIDM